MVGKYILFFKDVCQTFLKVLLVVAIFVMGFGTGFYMLLSHRDNFEFSSDSFLKTIIMMSALELHDKLAPVDQVVMEVLQEKINSHVLETCK